MNKVKIIIPFTRTLKREDVKPLITSIPPIATTEDNIYNVHGFIKEGDTQSILLSHNTYRGTKYHKIKIKHHKYQTDTFTIDGKRYNTAMLKEC